MEASFLGSVKDSWKVLAEIELFRYTCLACLCRACTQMLVWYEGSRVRTTDIVRDIRYLGARFDEIPMPLHRQDEGEFDEEGARVVIDILGGSRLN